MKNVGLNTLPSVKGNVFNLTVNLVCVAVFYVFLGGLLSWAMWRVFPSFDADWEKQSNFYQLTDVAVEISIIVIVTFWVTYLVNSFIPVIPMNQGLESYLESFGGQTMFVYAVFVFLEGLDKKLKHVYHDFLGTKSLA
jgi:uncharacterized Tic20 family protein